MMNLEKQIEYAKVFQEMHLRDKMFVLPNAWNAGSAVVFQKQGFEAIGTTSAGIAYAMGYADGEVVTMDDLCDITRQMTRRLSVPLSVDMERGYGDTVHEVRENVKRIIEAGAVGINIEDGYTGEHPYLEPLDVQVGKIKALVALREELGIPFVINARTCVYWLEMFSEQDRLVEAIERGKAFAEAGADCVFVPGGMSEDIVARLVTDIPVPINIVANPVYNDFQGLGHIGVRRLSIGSGAVRAVFAELIKMSKELDRNDSIQAMLNHGFSYDAANHFFTESV